MDIRVTTNGKAVDVYVDGKSIIRYDPVVGEVDVKNWSVCVPFEDINRYQDWVVVQKADEDVVLRMPQLLKAKCVDALIKHRNERIADASKAVINQYPEWAK